MPTTFNCSMCSAPLDVTNATGATVRCHYCGNTSILPEELRGVSKGHASGAGAGSLGSMVDQAVKMAEVAKLARAGKKIEAIKLYRETFGTSLKDAKDAVEQMETGQHVVFTHADFPGAHIPTQPFQAAQLLAQAASPQAKRVGRWVVILVLLLIAVPIIIAAVSMISAFKAVQHTTDAVSTSFPGQTSTATPQPTPGFATAALEFGSEGIGASQFKDARSIAVDGDGRIYVGEYSLGRVQVFDAQGKFLTQWMVDPKKALLNLAVDRKGIVYVVHPSAILRYDGATGNLLGEVAKPASNRYESYYDAFVALDGSLYAIGNYSSIIRIGADGEVKSVIDVKQKVGDNVRFSKLAVDGNGYIYALADHEYSVYKFAPDGRFINKFGGQGKEAGQLQSPHNIATDGQGRVYVSDLGRGVEVFDNNGRYIASFGNGEVIFGLAINDRNEIFAAERNRFKVVKYVPTK